VPKKFPREIKSYLTTRVPPSMKFKIISPNESIDRRFGAAWRFNNNNNFNKMWFSHLIISVLLALVCAHLLKCQLIFFYFLQLV